ncbi:c-type cytochrome biogenesis protein CcmI [Limnohabitans sp. G3-2]|uniref:c-type cytochrome biogenesis protein CcmI n=1 Tax=Limnohabitans sp. G3-2 TaxID=1100711 RepID=UPI000C1F86EE|nr:c-type cytochrome biogenesis protein CcmI [Limnohabitans sp. G3-2]PIT72821.1 c-type cytochrome biogenesis protein CcmI [Limnohabitans sp. G3-2]
MSFLPPWLGLILLLLLLGGLAAGVLRWGWGQQRPALGSAEQSRANRQIHQQHLADVDRAWAEGRLTPAQHQTARDELLRHLLADAAQADDRGGAGVPVPWLGLVVALVLLSGGSYWQLGAPQSWWPEPLSQRVRISASTPEQLAEQTRLWLKTTQQKPQDAEAWLTLARLHAAQNAHALAEQALARVLALSPEPDVWIERAQMKALSAGGVYAGEPWQWIQDVLRAQPMHLNALVLAGSAAWSEKRPVQAQMYWQQALRLVPAESEAAQGLQQALAQVGPLAQVALLAQQAAVADVADVAKGRADASGAPAAHAQPLIQGEVRVSNEVKSQLTPGATLFVYAVAEEGSRRPVAIWRGTPTSWPVSFALSDSMGMGAPPLLSSLAQVRLVARISKTGSAQKQADDVQVELPGVKTGVQGVVLQISAR